MFSNVGYKVIFLYRAESVFPFSTGLRKGTSGNFDEKLLSKFEDKKQGIYLNIDTNNSSRMKSELRCYNHCIKNKMLLSISFTTINEYLFLLQFISEQINYLKEKVCFYLAAAVSDFYIPDEEVKIKFYIFCALVCVFDSTVLVSAIFINLFVHDFYIPEDEVKN